MKLINYNRGYIPEFNCSIHGTLYMNQWEWQNVMEYLKRYPEDPNRYLFKDIMLEDIERKIPVNNGEFAVNIRVNYTNLVVDTFQLQILNAARHKKGNYQIIVKE